MSICPLFSTIATLRTRKGFNMAKQRMIVTDDQLLIDMNLLFNAIREADGDWEKVEQDMKMYLQSIQNMVEEEDEEDE